jgi:hypothetical protein
LYTDPIDRPANLAIADIEKSNKLLSSIALIAAHMINLSCSSTLNRGAGAMYNLYKILFECRSNVILTYFLLSSSTKLTWIDGLGAFQGVIV